MVSGELEGTACFGKLTKSRRNSYWVTLVLWLFSQVLNWVMIMGKEKNKGYTLDPTKLDGEIFQAVGDKSPDYILTQVRLALGGGMLREWCFALKQELAQAEQELNCSGYVRDFNRDTKDRVKIDWLDLLVWLKQAIQIRSDSFRKKAYVKLGSLDIRVLQNVVPDIVESLYELKQVCNEEMSVYLIDTMARCVEESWERHSIMNTGATEDIFEVNGLAWQSLIEFICYSEVQPTATDDKQPTMKELERMLYPTLSIFHCISESAFVKRAGIAARTLLFAKQLTEYLSTFMGLEDHQLEKDAYSFLMDLLSYYDTGRVRDAIDFTATFWEMFINNKSFQQLNIRSLLREERRIYDRLSALAMYYVIHEE